MAQAEDHFRVRVVLDDAPVEAALQVVPAGVGRVQPRRDVAVGRRPVVVDVVHLRIASHKIVHRLQVQRGPRTRIVGCLRNPRNKSSFIAS